MKRHNSWGSKCYALPLWTEALEPRTLLSAGPTGNPVEALKDTTVAETPAALTPSSFSRHELTVTGITIAVNGMRQDLRPSDGPIVLKAGDRLQIVDVQYETDAAIADSGGVLSVEGYLRKVGREGRTFDYADGRFSQGVDVSQLNPEGALGQGFQSAWTVQSGWDRLALSVVHYQGNAAAVIGRLVINVQVGTPDFEHATDLLMALGEQKYVAGEEASLVGAWQNSGEGNYENYAEVDIYFAEDLSQPVWVGVLTGSNAAKGAYTNPNPNDAFAERWTPDVAGDYVLKFYTDPEHTWQEADETNNTFDVRITVEDAETPVPDPPTDPNPETQPANEDEKDRSSLPSSLRELAVDLVRLRQASSSVTSFKAALLDRYGEVLQNPTVRRGFNQLIYRLHQYGYLDERLWITAGDLS